MACCHELVNSQTYYDISKGKSHMTNVGVGVMDVNVLKVCTHASKIKVNIDRHDV